MTDSPPPKDKGKSPGENRGAKPGTDTPKPPKPPAGGSGVTSNAKP